MSFRYKNFKQFYYLKSTLKLLIPNRYFQWRLSSLLKHAEKRNDKSYLFERINHYIKIEKPFASIPDSLRIGDIKFPDKLKTYHFDTREFTRYFPDDYRINRIFGDVSYLPKNPSIVKSRPITPDNSNAILLNLNKIRHFTFPKDITPYHQKKNKLIWRGALYEHHTLRLKCLQTLYDYEQCDIGHTSNRQPYLKWRKPRLNMYNMLQHKFVMVIEGNDVATSLKWVMASNSVVIMTKPRFETWFMESKLIPDYHYILVNDDYSDVIEKINHYLAHPDQALQIINNAHAYIQQFKNKKREKLISLMVLNKYFQLQQ